MIKIKNLTAKIKNIDVLKNINLTVNPGEIHAIMGARHSGKSSLAHAILGNPILDIHEGNITFNRRSIMDKTIEQRNLLGIFTTFQYLPILDGISNFDLTKAILKAHKDKRSLNEIEKEYKLLIKELGLSSNHGHKITNNETMTATECKKNELLQIMITDPKLIVLDEIDADIEEDELETFALNIKNFLKNKKKAAIVITHSKRFLDLLEPTHVNIMVQGAIQRKGSQELYKRIVEDGYTQCS